MSKKLLKGEIIARPPNSCLKLQETLIWTDYTKHDRDQ